MERKGEKERIQVLLAAYNGEAYIGEQIDSILEQTVPGVELLISDDGSSDRTPEILREYHEKYPERITLYDCRRRSAGSGEGRGRAPQKSEVPAPASHFFRLLDKADADYILFSDQDDVWKPEKTAVLLEEMKKLERGTPEGNRLPALVFSDMEVVDEQLRSIAPGFFAYSRVCPDRTFLSGLLVENPVTGGAMMINRALARLALPEPDACCMHDWWIALCASCFGQISCVKEALSEYRQHSSNVLGARRTGSLKDVRERLRRTEQVRDNYLRMFAQARAFEDRYGGRLSAGQRETLRAFDELPYQRPAQRLVNMIRNRFAKSSRLLTLAQCFTIPYMRG